MGKDVRREKFPGCTNVTVGEAGVWARVCKEEGKNPEQTLRTINLIDDLLAIQESALLLNQRRGNTIRRKTMKDVMIARIMQEENI